MTRYELAVRENDIKKVIWQLENTVLKYELRAHQKVLKAQLKLEKDKFDSWYTSHKDKAKNLYHIKNQFIERVKGIRFPDSH
jgi:hypothetical protein